MRVEYAKIPPNIDIFSMPIHKCLIFTLTLFYTIYCGFEIDKHYLLRYKICLCGSQNVFVLWFLRLF
jgi:hypothetical protein